MSISKDKLASMIEHTLLGNNLDEKRVLEHLQQAKELGVYGVCIPCEWIALAKKNLDAQKNNIKIITVIDFPHGQKSSREKAQEAHMAIALGVDEIDMVLDYQALINKNYDKAFEDLLQVINCAKNTPIKVIVETSALTREQLIAATTLVALSKARFIKTSTGFHKAGADIKDIALMRALLPEHIQIKASGGIKTYEQACSMIKAGATRIGASQSKQILLNSLGDSDACY